jgi:hypothetical protein
VSIIRWETPPPFTTAHRTTDRTPWAAIAVELRARPGEWAVVHEGKADVSMQRRIRLGTSPWFRPAGAFEATQRRGGDGVVATYARYVGPAGASS